MIYFISKKYAYKGKTMNSSKEIVASNIASLRQDAGMTQAEFAKQLNYTDKAISKWERAESIPDVFVLATIAELFGVTVDYLLATHEDKEIFNNPLPQKKYNRLALSLLSIMPVWLIATLAYVIGVPFINTDRMWLAFVVAVPVSAIVLLVFSAVWHKEKLVYLFVSVLIWTILGFVYLLFYEQNYWLLFTVGIPLQLAVLLWARVIVIKK